MTLYQLEVYLAVVQSGSFTRAGELLLTSQSGVSHTIADLEKELGIILFTRNRNSIKLTEAGERILPHAREMVDQKSKIIQVAAEAKGVRSGTLRIGAFPSFSANVIPGIVQSFRSRYPGVELLLFEGSYAEIEAWLKAGTVDVGFLVNPCEGLDIIPLISDPYVAVLPATHPLSGVDEISIAQLADERFLLLKSGCERLVLRALEENDLSLKRQLEVAENSTIISMVEAGIGVSIVPSMILPVMPVNIVVKRITPPITRVIGLAVCSQEPPSSAVTAFIKETQSLLSPYEITATI